MAINVHIDVDMGEVVARVERIKARFNNLDLKLLATDVMAEIDDLIQAEGELTGDRWAALSEETLRLHPHRHGGKLLQDTGLLANIQPIVGDNFFGARSPAPYAGFHVTGTRKMPKRDFLDVDFNTLLERIGTEIAKEVSG